MTQLRRTESIAQVVFYCVVLPWSALVSEFILYTEFKTYLWKASTIHFTFQPQVTGEALPTRASPSFATSNVFAWNHMWRKTNVDNVIVNNLHKCQIHWEIKQLFEFG